MPEPKEESPAAPEMPPLAMDTSAYLREEDDGTMPPPPQQQQHSTLESEPKLVEPQNVKSRFWAHFMKYNVEFHPDKKTTARCSICGKDISVKQGTGGLKNHLKFKHPEENALLFENDESTPLNVSDTNLRASRSFVCTPIAAPTTGAAGTLSRGGGSASMMPAKKKPRHHFNSDNASYSDLAMRMDASKRADEKHLMEMWTLTRCELRNLRKELKDEELDECVMKELEGDVRALKQRKAEFAELLGFPKDEEEKLVETPVTEDV